ncbi:MAG: hypothetical protein ACKVOB_01050 [Sphingomonas sp.]
MTPDDQPAGPPGYVRPGRQRASTRTLLLLFSLAFALGIGATVLLVRQFHTWLPGFAKAMLAPTDAQESTAAVKPFSPPAEQTAVGETFDREMLGAREATLAAQLASLEARAAAISTAADAAAGNAGRAERLLVAFAVRRAIDRGLPLGPVETELQRLFGASQPGAVAIIARASRNPVTLEDLRLGLDGIAPVLSTGAAADGWWASFRRELASLVVIRREGTPSPRPAERLARIRRMIDAQQIDAAIVDVGRLPGAGQADVWQALAHRYVEAHKALDAIELSVLASPAVFSTLAAAPPPPQGQPETSKSVPPAR